MPESPVAEPPPRPPHANARTKGLTWPRFFAALFLVLIISTAGMAVGTYRAGLAGKIPPYNLFVFILLAYPIAGVILTAVNGNPSRWLRLVAFILTFALYDGILAHFFGFRDLYLRGLAERVSHTDLEPVKRWAATHIPADGNGGWNSVDDKEIPDDVRQAIPLKGLGGPQFSFFHPTRSWLLRITIRGGGFTSSAGSGIILTLGKDVDPSTVDVTRRALRVFPNVWVFDG